MGTVSNVIELYFSTKKNYFPSQFLKPPATAVELICVYFSFKKEYAIHCHYWEPLSTYLT